jgi:hypothetical protein
MSEENDIVIGAGERYERAYALGDHRMIPEGELEFEKIKDGRVFQITEEMYDSVVDSLSGFIQKTYGNEYGIIIHEMNTGDEIRYDPKKKTLNVIADDNSEIVGELEVALG